MSDLRVELLAVESCPHFERTRRALESVLREGIIETPIQVVFVATQDDAEFLDFPGSPTIRVNGDDVVPEPGLAPALGCRLYRDEEGRVIDGPPIEAIRAVVRAHRRGRLEAFQRGEAGLVAEYARAAAADELGAEAPSRAEDAKVDAAADPSRSASPSPAERPTPPERPAPSSGSHPSDQAGGASR